ncbi:MAG TPA: hypothetical protein VFE42_37230 [Chloroflexota bacterium]|nr:hypothetical protein [Chloroflexota bacterium]
MPPALAAKPVPTVQVTGTVQRMLPYSLVLQMPKHRVVRVYFASITPLLARFGRTILVAEIKSGHRLVITGKYQGSKTFFATLIRDTSIT